MKIAILGFGVVGSGAYEVLEKAGYKVGRVLGMPYPGGAALDKAAQQGDETKYPPASANASPYPTC